jgi:hypothetical protein
MKTNKIYYSLFGFVLLSAVAFFSCDNTVSLGNRLDTAGPVVSIDTPASRALIPDSFTMTGSARDDSGVKEMLLKATYNHETESGSGVFVDADFERQWRVKAGIWEISDDGGINWAPYDASGQGVWNGTAKSASWELTIALQIGTTTPEGGEYLFTLQAWDTAGITDQHSFTTRTVIYDDDPPAVTIIAPALYAYNNPDPTEETDPELIKLDNLSTKEDREEPSRLGVLLNEDVRFQWQIEDRQELRSFALKLFEKSVDLINYPDSPPLLIETINVPPPDPSTGEEVRPNGSHTFSKDDFIGAGITEKRTLKVVVTCYDEAGHENQTKLMGYFVYWPDADKPWITFPSDFRDDNTSDFFMVYPTGVIKANAFDDDGVEEVVYSIYNVNYGTNPLGEPGESPLENFSHLVKENKPRHDGTKSQTFSWEFNPPGSTGDYYIKAWVFDHNDSIVDYVDENGTVHFIPGKSESDYPADGWKGGFFKVQDITFPEFPVSASIPANPLPPASDALFMAAGVNDGKLTIEGFVTDDSGITNVSMVWINPESANYAAMSQLSYFRDSNYNGWQIVNGNIPDSNHTGGWGGTGTGPGGALKPGESAKEGFFDAAHPNMVWNLAFTSWDFGGAPGLDPETGRKLYKFSQEIDLAAALNISAGKQPLSSQVFLFRAQDDSAEGKCTVITYAPQGDALAPTVAITGMTIVNKDNYGKGGNTGGPNSGEYIPNVPVNDGIPTFEDGDKITVTGTWTEDSTAYLDLEELLRSVTINTMELLESEIEFTPDPGNVSGTWTATATIGSAGESVQTSRLYDALVINVVVTDAGGNISEAGSSFLIQSEKLRLLRVSSDDQDKLYKAGDSVDIFLEFNKPVTLKGSGTPRLLLNSDTGGQAFADYIVSPPQTAHATKQYFRYTILQGHTTDISTDAALNYLNVLSLDGDSSHTSASYTNTWETAAGESLKIVNPGTTPPEGASDYAYLPVSGPPGVPNPAPGYNLTYYLYSLIAGKRIEIDTKTPAITGIVSGTRAQSYGAGNQVYITVTFSEAIDPATAENAKLSLSAKNSANSCEAVYESSGSDSITFIYTVKAGDNTGGAPPGSEILAVEGITGNISDIAGNLLPGAAFGAYTGTKELKGSGSQSGIKIDTTAPRIPRLEVTNGEDSPVVLGFVDKDATGDQDLKNIYSDKLGIRIAADSDSADPSYDVASYEYTTDGTHWVTVPGVPSFSQTLTLPGNYTFKARQIDSAGNSSPESKAITLFWDKGAVLNRISSDKPNGTYTRRDSPERHDEIPITLYFRKPVIIASGTPTITLNTGAVVNADLTVPTAAVESLTFTYKIGNDDNTPGGDRLKVTAVNLAGITDAEGVALDSSMVDLGAVQAGKLLEDLKEFYVKTGPLAISGTPGFANDGGSADENDPGFLGIRSDDGAYWTTFVVNYDRPIYRGTGTLAIIQAAGTSADTYYRIPAVLTETQYARFRSIPNFADYYEKGTNGFKDGASDISTKYVLKDGLDTHTIDPTDPTGTFPEAFRQKEKIELLVNAQAVEISGTTLTIRLTGSNALQVPGAAYEITIPEGFVQDGLGYPSPVIDKEQPAGAQNGLKTLDGVSRPFIRVERPQETITAATGSATVPAYTAAQPLTAYIRLDSRTPGSTVNWNANYYLDNTDGASNLAAALTSANDPAAPRAPSDSSGTVPDESGTITSNGGSITIPIATEARTQYRGYKFRIIAQSQKGTWSTAAEEVAYRTVLTLVFGTNLETTNGQGLQNGETVWVRGGNNFDSSDVPGYPLTWMDSWDSLVSEKSRAGIRLMTKTSDGTYAGNNASTWKWVSWGITVPTYINFYRGDSSGSADEVWQFGPRSFSSTRGGWTPNKTYYPLIPGQHRWVSTAINTWTAAVNSGGINTTDTMSFVRNLVSRDTNLTPNLSQPSN